jgi:transglutaminase-like putative cysteine protease
MRMYQVRSSDIDDRISWMEAEINDGQRSARIREIASHVLTQKTPTGDWQVEERDWKGELAAAFSYVRDNVRYTRDIHDVELFQKPERTLELGIGDCDDLTILLGSLLGNIGYPLRARVVATGGNTFHHVYLMAGVPPHNPDEWIALDASRAEGPGWEVSGITRLQDYEISTF